MESSVIDPVEERASLLLANAGEEMLDRIASARRDIREKALQVLLNPLDLSDPHDHLAFQSLALKIASEGDPQAALSYIETLGNLGSRFSWDLIERVYDIAISHINSGYGQGNKAGKGFLNKKIDLLITMLGKKTLYAESPRYHLIQGQEYERRGQRDKAIEYYNLAIERGDSDGLFYISRIYRETKDYDSALYVLHYGWDTLQERRFGKELVGLYSELGNLPEAKKVYLEMYHFDTKRQGDEKGTPELSENIEPFFLLSERVESDEDLFVFEQEMANHMRQKDYYPSDKFRNLAVSADAYIQREVERMNAEAQILLSSEYPSQIESDTLKYKELVFRRLALMQVHLFTLKLPTYLQAYLGDIEMLADGTLEAKELLGQHFEDHYSPEVAGLQDDKVSEPLDSEETPYIYEPICEHLDGLARTFHNGEFYEVKRDRLAPIFLKYAKIGGLLEDEMEIMIYDGQEFLKMEADYIVSMREEFRDFYYKLIAKLDTKYGVFYRRSIQNRVLETAHAPMSEYPKICFQVPEIALLFVIEKIVSDTFPVEQLSIMIDSYRLLSLDEDDTLVFAAFLIDISVEDAIEILISFPGILNRPEALLLLLEGFKLLPSSVSKKAIKEIHQLCRTSYGSRGMYDHMKKVLGKKDQGDISDTDLALMHEMSGDIANLQGARSQESPMEHYNEGVELKSSESMIKFAQGLENRGYYDDAMAHYEQAYLSGGSIYAYSQLVSCAIRAGQFVKAESYIGLGLRQGHDVASHIFALLLWQGKIKEALEQAVNMIGRGKEILDMPEGTLILLYETISKAISNPYESIIEEHEMKLLASFLGTKLLVNNTIKISYLEVLGHWQYIEEAIGELGNDLSELSRFINKTLGIFIQEPPTFEGISEQDKALKILNLYAASIHNELQRNFQEYREAKDYKNLYKVFQYVNDFIARVILVLSKFPGGKEFSFHWHDSLNFMKEDGVSIFPSTLGQDGIIH